MKYALPLLTAGLLACAPALLCAQTALPDAELQRAAPFAESRFGHAVAIDGGRALVAAPRDGTSAPLGGAVEVFERQPDGSWSSAATLVPSTAGTIALAGQALALDGDTALIGSVLGFVTVFERSASGVWSETAVLTAPVANATSFGIAVAIDGDRVAVSAVQGTLFSPSNGRVFVFERNAGVWGHVATATAQSVGPAAPFWTALALEGDRIAAGSPSMDSPFFDNGAVFVFERQASSVWQQTDVVQPATSVISARHGEALAIGGDVLIVGSPGSNASTLGSVRVLQRQGDATWLDVGMLLAPDGTPGDRFGASLALTDGHLVVGAPLADVDVVNAGALYVFERLTATDFDSSVTIAHPAAVGGDELGSGTGRSMAASGSTVLAGTPGANVATGRAFVFELGTLYHDDVELSIAAHDVQQLFVRAGPPAAGDLYFVLGSATGTEPAIPLAPSVELPLVFDAYTNMCLDLTAPLASPLGVLDTSGAALSAFTVPNGLSASFAGVVLHHACLTIDLTTFDVGATNAVKLALVP